MKYPDDANGDALRRMEEAGDDLTRPRDVEFTVVFPNENTAKQFADHVSALGYAASAELIGTVADFPWDVIVVKHMVPSHEEIGAVEDSLQHAADIFGGRNDGLGVFVPLASSGSMSSIKRDVKISLIDPLAIVGCELKGTGSHFDVSMGRPSTHRKLPLPTISYGGIVEACFSACVS